MISIETYLATEYKEKWFSIVGKMLGNFNLIWWEEFITSLNFDNHRNADIQINLIKILLTKILNNFICNAKDFKKTHRCILFDKNIVKKIIYCRMNIM